jgi:hypothetical protein
VPIALNHPTGHAGSVNCVQWYFLNVHMHLHNPPQYYLYLQEKSTAAVWPVNRDDQTVFLTQNNYTGPVNYWSDTWSVYNWCMWMKNSIEIIWYLMSKDAKMKNTWNEGFGDLPTLAFSSTSFFNISTVLYFNILLHWIPHDSNTVFNLYTVVIHAPSTWLIIQQLHILPERPYSCPWHSSTF